MQRLDKRELLSQYLNEDISRDELSSQLKKEEPLLFELIEGGDWYLDENFPIPPETKGCYFDANGNKFVKPYSWFKQEAQFREVAICLIGSNPGLENTLIDKI